MLTVRHESTSLPTWKFLKKNVTRVVSIPADLTIEDLISILLCPELWPRWLHVSLFAAQTFRGKSQEKSVCVGFWPHARPDILFAFQWNSAPYWIRLTIWCMLHSGPAAPPPYGPFKMSRAKQKNFHFFSSILITNATLYCKISYSQLAEFPNSKRCLKSQVLRKQNLYLVLLDLSPFKFLMD